MSRRRAGTTYLEPGQHSVDRNTPTERTLDGKEVFALDWSVRLFDGRLVQKRTQGASKTEVQRRARAKAKALLATGGKRSRWSSTTPIETYLDEVASKEIDDANLRPASLTAYRRVLKLLRGELSGYGIADAWHYDVLVAALEAIAGSSGYEAARHARIVASLYVAQPLMRHRLVDRDPLAGARLNLKRHAPTPKPRPAGDKKGLTPDEQARVIEYLLALDPAKGAMKPSRGRWTLEHVISKRRNAIDLTILQAGAAPRISEALQLAGGLLQVSDGEEMQVHVTAEIAKTGIARRTPVSDSRIAEHLMARRQEALEHGGYLIGRPTDPQKRWPSSGNGGAGPELRKLYDELADQLNIPFLKNKGVLTHMWRTTLTSRYLEAGIARKSVAAMIGHDEVTSEKHYTDGVDLGAARAAYVKHLNP